MEDIDCVVTEHNCVYILFPRSWPTTLRWLQRQDFFSTYFIEIPEGQSWWEPEFLESQEERIPLELLERSTEAETVFQTHVTALRQHHKRTEWVWVRLWISNYIYSKVRAEITYLFPNFNGATIEVGELQYNTVLQMVILDELIKWLKAFRNILYKFKACFQSVLLCAI